MHSNLKILSLATVIALTMIGKASAMEDDFLRDLNTTYPTTYQDILNRIDDAHKQPHTVPQNADGFCYLPFNVENRKYELTLDVDDRILEALFSNPGEPVNVTPMERLSPMERAEGMHDENEDQDFYFFTPTNLSLTSTFRIKRIY
jgi:hypothetical protein